MDLGTLHMRRSLRLLVLAGLLPLAVAGFTACAGDDDEPQESDAGAPTQTQGEPRKADKGADSKSEDGGNARPSSGPVLTGNVEEAREGVEAVDDVYEGFDKAVDAGVAATNVPAGETLEVAEDVESLTNVCDLMSEAAKRQTIVYAERSAGLADVDWTCEKATGLLLRRARQAGGLKRSLRAEVVGVNVEGDRATASIRFGGKGPVSSVPMVKEDGDWKLAASPSKGGGR